MSSPPDRQRDASREGPATPTLTRTGDARRTSLKESSRRSPGAFFLLVFGLSVPFWLIGAATKLQLAPGLPVSALSAACPLLAALILVNRVDRTAGVTVADPDRCLSELPLLTEPERRQLLTDWNATEKPVPDDRCVHELFEEQVARAE
jgi:hypothetical protein